MQVSLGFGKVLQRSMRTMNKEFDDILQEARSIKLSRQMQTSSAPLLKYRKQLSDLSEDCSTLIHRFRNDSGIYDLLYKVCDVFEENEKLLDQMKEKREYSRYLEIPRIGIKKTSFSDTLRGSRKLRSRFLVNENEKTEKIESIENFTQQTIKNIVKHEADDYVYKRDEIDGMRIPPLLQRFENENEDSDFDVEEIPSEDELEEFLLAAKAIDETSYNFHVPGFLKEKVSLEDLNLYFLTLVKYCQEMNAASEDPSVDLLITKQEVMYVVQDKNILLALVLLKKLKSYVSDGAVYYKML
ncbi:hypothetical protein PCE1_000247 [Barthelona sp. PCE]